MTAAVGWLWSRPGAFRTNTFFARVGSVLLSCLSLCNTMTTVDKQHFAYLTVPLQGMCKSMTRSPLALSVKPRLTHACYLSSSSSALQRCAKLRHPLPSSPRRPSSCTIFSLSSNTIFPQYLITFVDPSKPPQNRRGPTWRVARQTLHYYRWQYMINTAATVHDVHLL